MRKFILLICLAFVVVCYGYPCFVMPFGAYVAETETEILEEKITTRVSYEFKFDGTCKFATKIGDAEEISKDCYYKLKGTKVIISLDDEFTDADTEIEIASMYKLGGMKNAIALYVTIGVGVLALLAIVWPSKR